MFNSSFHLKVDFGQYIQLHNLANQIFSIQVKNSLKFKKKQ